MRGTERHPAKQRANSTLPLLLVLIAAGGILYSNTFKSPFVLDDRPYILDDAACHPARLTPGALARAAFEGRPSRRPIPNLSFAINYYIGGQDPTGYHAVNIAVHLLAGIFLFLLIRRTLVLSYGLPPGGRPAGRPAPDAASPDVSPETAAFFAALIWLVHPAATESVTYICQRMTAMAAMFYILSLLLYVKARTVLQMGGARAGASSGLYFAGCAAAGLCALASKENAATLPLFILLYEWYFFRDPGASPFRRRILWVLCAMAVFIGIAIIWLGTDPVQRILSAYAKRDFTLPQRVLTEFRVIIYYVSLFFWPAPSRLNLDHDYPLSVSLAAPFTTILCLGAVAALLAAALYAARKDRLLSFGLLWFLGTLVIESSIIPIEIIFEHRTYLPFAMLYPALVLFLLRTIRPRRAAIALLGLIVLSASVWTYQRNCIWADSLPLLEDCVHKAPDKARPRQNLATTLLMRGNAAEAARQFYLILKSHPDFISAYNNLANIFVQSDHIPKAFDCYIAALKAAPETGYYRYHIADVASVHFNLGSVLFYRQMFQEAEFQLGEGLEINPANAQAHELLGMVLVRLNRVEEAKTQFRTALSLDPGLTGVRKQLKQAEALSAGDGLKHKIHPPSAGLSPENEILYVKLGDLYRDQGDCGRAAGAYQKALLIHPENRRARAGLDACRESNGDRK